MPAQSPPTPHFATLTHEALFGSDEPRCDACGAPLADEDEELRTSGLYVWVRGGRVVYEEPPLCVACGTAISMSAMARWEIEEEEG